MTQISPETEAHDAVLAGQKDEQDAVLTRAQSLVIEHVVHDRPLARLQERLDHEGDLVGVAAPSGGVDDEEKGTSGVEGAGEVENEAAGEGDGAAATDGVNGHAADEGSTTPTETSAPTPVSSPPPPPKIKHKMLLHNNDNELLRIEEVSHPSSRVRYTVDSISLTRLFSFPFFFLMPFGSFCRL